LPGMVTWAAFYRRRQRLILAAVVYLVCTAVYMVTAAPRRVTRHTEANHYALLADAWLRGRLDLGHPAPEYTRNNDFSYFEGRWYVSFPPFPAVIMTPLVAAAGSPERVRDGQVWLWMAGLAPALLFLLLEKLRRTQRTDLSLREDLLFTALFAFGTVYYFTALQGTVWFAAHVVATTCLGAYLLFALDADQPLLAGLMIALAFACRGMPIALAGLLFVFEAIRVGLRPPPAAPGPWPLLARLDLRATLIRLARFAVPVLAVVLPLMWLNHHRFHSAFEFGHRYLTVAWRARIEKCGLFSYHYLGRNLGVMWTGLPFVGSGPRGFQINVHGLAIWLTMPFYLFVLWPRRTNATWKGMAVVAGLVGLGDLLYQNSGWSQFGYRFSNDYSLILFAMLAMAHIRRGRWFWTTAAVAVVVNTFGALTFDRADQLYYTEPSQTVFYQPD
jgi:hypothetical protein